MYRSRFLSSMMIELGYDAVAVGEKELSYGLRAILEDAANGLPVICANLYREGERLFPPAVIKEVHGTRIGIMALLSERPADEGDLEIRDPVTEGLLVMEELEKETDYTILLAHMRKEKLREVITALDGIDLVIRGHAAKGQTVSGDCADTLGGIFEEFGIPVLFAGEKGKAIGMAGISFDESGKPALTDTVLIELKRSMPRDPEIAALMKDFSISEGARLREMSISEFLSRDPVTGRIRERYLGMETCARCHFDIMSEFMTTPHFRAFTRLTVAGKEDDPSCMACHTVGYGHFSGYSVKSEERGATNLRGVQCEACHGPGTIHRRDGSYAAGARKSCRRCHTPEWTPDFDYEEMMKHIHHCVGADSSGTELHDEST
ncbi:MAG: hypothetical protein KAV42_10240 [Candidatus Krumholzibacteria bacterium]|nr:hypothetical protein [Candidatus Krumholzibacteria bacterium]